MQLTIHKLAKGQFAKVPCPTTRSISDNPPPLEDIPSAPVRQGTPWPNVGLASENLFETRKDWPIPPYSSPHTCNPTIKTEEQPKTATIPHATKAMPKQNTEKCSWGLHCPICKNEEQHGEEDWNGDLQNQPRMQPLKPLAPDHTKPPTPESPMPTATDPFSIPNHKAVNMLRNKTFSIASCRTIKNHLTIPDRYAEQIRLQREWEKKVERLNKKYNLDCFSSSELDSESDEEENYKYEHKYETLI